jgi:hypothetical protein
VLPLPLIIAVLVGWIEWEQRDLFEFLREENRVLKAQLHGRRMRLSDDERRRLAVIRIPAMHIELRSGFVRWARAVLNSRGVVCVGRMSRKYPRGRTRRTQEPHVPRNARPRPRVVRSSQA